MMPELLSSKKCPYSKNCYSEGIQACYNGYERCTIYCRNKIIRQRIETSTKPDSKIEKIVR